MNEKSISYGAVILVRASDIRVLNPRRAGFAWAIGVIDGSGVFHVVTRRRITSADTPTDVRVWVKCDGDVAAGLEKALGCGVVKSRSRATWWMLRSHEIVGVLEAIIPFMRCAKRVKMAQVVLAVALTRGQVGKHMSEVVRASRIEAMVGERGTTNA